MLRGVCVGALRPATQRITVRGYARDTQRTIVEDSKRKVKQWQNKNMKQVFGNKTEEEPLMIAVRRIREEAVRTRDIIVALYRIWRGRHPGTNEDLQTALAKALKLDAEEKAKARKQDAAEKAKRAGKQR